MFKVVFTKTTTVRLFIIGIICCYLSTLFQNNLLTLAHDFSHKVVSKNHHHHHSNHDFLSIRSLENKDKHPYESVHKHKALSFFKTILDYNASDDPYSTNKIKYKLDKHIVAIFLFNKSLLISDITMNYYWFILDKLTMPELKKAGPPPKCIFS